MKHQNKISRKLALYILLFSSLITLILTGVQLFLDYRYGINVIHQRLEQIANTNIDAFEHALWTLNMSSVELQLQGLSKINDVVNVELIGTSGEVVRSYSGVDGKPFESRRYPLYYLFRDQQNYLGTVVVSVTKAQLFQRLIDKTLIILMNQAIKTFIVTLFIVMLFQHLVTRHIRRIAEFARSIDFLHEIEPLKLERAEKENRVDDELDLLVNSINDMQHNLVEIFRNLTESKDDVARSDARFESIFNSIDYAVVFANVNHRIVHVNRTFHELFQYVDDELMGNTTQMIYANPAEYGVQGENCYNDNGRSSGSRYEIKYRKKDGSIFPSETRGVHVTTEDGIHIGYLGIIRDISDEIADQEQLQQLQRQLMQAQKMEAIGQLTGGIAHDFNNILGIILGHAELAVNSYKKGEFSTIGHNLKRIHDAAIRARDLVTKLLQFGRGTAVTSVSQSLNRVIEGSLKLLQGLLPSSINVVVEMGENLPTISIDSVQLEQVILNLAINARDAMGGSGTLTLRTSLQQVVKQSCSACAAPIDGLYVVLAVSDTGSGIASEVIENLFEPFASTKDKSQGGGLGLSVIHGILHQHGAHIRFRTQAGVGTSFYLYFPCVSEETNIESNVVLTESLTATRVGKKGRGGQLLVVDDEEAILEILKEVIGSQGYQVDGYSSPVEALAAFRDAPLEYDYIVTDNTMPEMTGVDLVNAIHEIKPEIPVILCSGNPDQIDIAMLSNPDKVLVMGKPVDIPSLIGHLR